MTYVLQTTLTNETRGHIFADFEAEIDEYVDDDGAIETGDLYRALQREYGRCRSSVYAEPDNKRIGWYFVSRQRYEDTNEPYLRGAWCTLQRKVASPPREYVAID